MPSLPFEKLQPAWFKVLAVISHPSCSLRGWISIKTAIRIKSSTSSMRVRHPAIKLCNWASIWVTKESCMLFRKIRGDMVIYAKILLSTGPPMSNASTETSYKPNPLNTPTWSLSCWILRARGQACWSTSPETTTNKPKLISLSKSTSTTLTRNWIKNSKIA